MKNSIHLSIIAFFAILFSACSTAYQPYSYDDVYYDPAQDPVKKAEIDPSEDLNKSENIQYQNSYPNRYTETQQSDNYPEGMYQNRYTETEAIENNNPGTNTNNQTVIINNNPSGDVEYYDPEYAETVSRLNTPVQSFNSYDPYLQARVAYTNDPFFYQPSLYAGYNFYDPFMPSSGLTIGWNSWSGWNVGIGIGFGYASWACANPYYNPWRPVFGYNPWNPWAPTFGYGMGYGWGCNPYTAGYQHGYYHGFHDGAYGDYKYGNNGRTYINTPRGSSGSRAFTEPRSNTRPQSTNGNYRLQNPENSNARIARPVDSRPNQTIEENRRTSTPSRYTNSRTPETYSKPTREERRPQASPTPSNRIQPGDNYNRPTRQPSQRTPSTNPRTPQNRPYSNEGYNTQKPLSPQGNTNYQVNPSIQSSPNNSINRSRPSYNTTPTYSPSPGGSRPGRSASPSRSAPSSRPRR